MRRQRQNQVSFFLAGVEGATRHTQTSKRDATLFKNTFKNVSSKLFCYDVLKSLDKKILINLCTIYLIQDLSLIQKSIVSCQYDILQTLSLNNYLTADYINST